MLGAVQRYTVSELRGLTVPQEGTGTITTALSEIRPSNPERVELIVINTGTTAARVGFTRSLTATTGILLPASGGVIQLVLTEDYLLLEHALYGIVASGSTTIWYSELVRATDTDVE